MTALDVKKRQILVRYDADPNITWHHRVLLARLVDHAWMVLTPDLAVQRLDVSLQPVVPLLRGRPIPELRRAHDEAGVLAEVYASNSGVVDEEVWVVAEPGHQRFGEVVPDEVMSDPERASVLGTKGSAQLEGEGEDSVVFVQQVVKKTLPDWKLERSGGGGLRLLGSFRSEAGKRRLPLREAVWACTETKFEDFPFTAERVCQECLRGIIEAADSDSNSYHRNFSASCGLGSYTANAHDHLILLETLRLLLQNDQVSAPKLAAAEQVTRRLVQRGLAVERDPKHPGCSGLGSLPAGSVEERGRVSVPMFQKTLAEKQQQRAQILMQARLLREEKVAEQRRRKGDGKGGKEQGKGGGGGGGASSTAG